MATIPTKLTHELYLPDEVLIEILLRLPLLSLQLFRSVSKQWLSLITSEYFIRRLRKPRIETPCGLFIRQHNSEHYDFLNLDPKVSSFPVRATFANAGSCFRILNSCNGLFLCRNYVSHRVHYYVYNPLTNLFKNIPFAREQWCTNMILAFDPTKSPYYKLVVTGKKLLDWDWGEDWEQDWEEDREQDSEEDREQDEEDEDWEEDNTIHMLIYSSETGKWRICGRPLFHEDSSWAIGDGIYWNNAIHWIHPKKLHCKLDIVDNSVVTNIQTPALDNARRTLLFESRSTLLLLMEDYDRCYHVFEMREESSEWSVKYIVDDIVHIVPSGWLQSCVLCIVLGERADDSFMVIESHNKILRYNFMSKTVSTICNFIPSHSLYDRVPFIASLASV